LLATVLAIKEAPVAVMDLLPHLTNICNRKDVRTAHIIGFLKTNGVKLTTLANNYENIMATDHASPIIIEYSVLRHSFESTDLPPSWIQFCILFKKEKLLVPFKQKGDAINLGNQYNEQKWTKDLTHYCSNNLKYRIAPVDRADKKGPKGPKIIVQGMHFNSAWAITMPAPDPKP
jgi:23S rRNA-/tRNA-specific pseudouridylate synthase